MVKSIPVICEYSCYPSMWFALSEPYVVTTSKCALPVNRNLLNEMQAHPTYRVDKYPKYTIVNCVADYRPNGVRYS